MEKPTVQWLEEGIQVVHSLGKETKQNIYSLIEKYTIKLLIRQLQSIF